MKTKNTIRLCLLIGLGLVVIFTPYCKKDEPATIPVLTTSPIINVTATTATSGGNITSDGRAKVKISGVCWSNVANPTISDSKTTGHVEIGQFVSEITGLTGGLTFHVRAYAINSVGTGYGADIESTTLAQMPSSFTQFATNLTLSGATLNGIVNANGLSTSVTFEYGTTISYGSTTTAAQSPVDGSDSTNVSADITGLTFGTTYHFRVKAVNSLGTTFGDDNTFNTYSITVKDIDGNIYNTLTIGTQVWMVENLKTTRYLNGDLIGTTNPATLDISLESTPKYQWAYDGNESNVIKYGRLYTGYAVEDPRNLCPDGWHVPTPDEWNILIDYLGGDSVAGGKLKEAGLAHWFEPNEGATNESGFTALPGGARYHLGTFDEFGQYGNWALSSVPDVLIGVRTMFYNNTKVHTSGTNKAEGYSIRCLQD